MEGICDTKIEKKLGLPRSVQSFPLASSRNIVNTEHSSSLARRHVLQQLPSRKNAICCIPVGPAERITISSLIMQCYRVVWLLLVLRFRQISCMYMTFCLNERPLFAPQVDGFSRVVIEQIERVTLFAVNFTHGSACPCVGPISGGRRHCSIVTLQTALARQVRRSVVFVDPLVSTLSFETIDLYTL